MELTDSTVPEDAFRAGLNLARQRLLPPAETAQRAWPALAAAAFFAFSAMTFAVAAILSPPAHLTPVPETVRGPV